MATESQGKREDKRKGRTPVHSIKKSERQVPRYTFAYAFDLFYQSKCNERLRELTLRDYRKHYGYLRDWLADIHPEIEHVDEITASVLREYVYFLSYEKILYSGHPYRASDDAKKGLAPGAVNIRINNVKAMFRWFHQEGLIPMNPSQNLTRQRVEEDRIGAFTDEQATLLLQQPDQETFAGMRDYVVIRLLLESGMRMGECLSLEVADIDFHSRIITLSGAKNKNRRMRIIPISPEMASLLMDVITTNKTYFTEKSHMFLANYGERLAQATITHHIKDYGRQAGIADQVRCSPHTCRHTFAKNFLMAGGDIIALQRILGHSSMEMVRKYVQHRVEDLREQHDRFSQSRKTDGNPRLR